MEGLLPTDLRGHSGRPILTYRWKITEIPRDLALILITIRDPLPLWFIIIYDSLPSGTVNLDF